MGSRYRASKRMAGSWCSGAERPTTMSRSPWASCASRWSVVPSTSFTRAWGMRSSSFITASGTVSEADAPDAPITTLPPPPSRSAAMSALARSSCASTRWAWAISTSPCGVGRKPRAWRSNSGNPMSSSRSFSHLDKPGCVVLSIAAEWLMLRVWARLSSIFRLRRRNR
ncbi:hypothetical protein D9M68_751390 [compost metagenome]